MNRTGVLGADQSGAGWMCVVLSGGGGGRTWSVASFCTWVLGCGASFIIGTVICVMVTRGHRGSFFMLQVV